MSVFARNISDALHVVTQALPAADANNNAAAFDLVSGGTFQPESIELLVDVPALPANTDTGKTIVLALQDSADNSSFAAVDPSTRVLIPGVGTTGSLAKQVRLKLPSTVRRFVRFNQAVEDGGGDNTAASITYKLLF